MPPNKNPLALPAGRGKVRASGFTITEVFSKTAIGVDHAGEKWVQIAGCRDRRLDYIHERRRFIAILPLKACHFQSAKTLSDILRPRLGRRFQ
jgi:hypothetical protein